MNRVKIVLLLAWLLFYTLAWPAEKPKVRAITGFVRLDRAQYQTQMREALDVLRKAKAVFEQAGYEVQGLRISTQPFPEYILGLPKQEAIAFLREYCTLAQKENFMAALGPAMVSDRDDPNAAEVLGEVLPTLCYASIVVAAEDGVHWNAVHAAAKLMRYLADHSKHSEANAAFAAIAMVPPNTPFYPGSYHAGEGHQFAIALQSANVVAEAFASATRNPKAAKQAFKAVLGEHAVRIEALAQRVEKETGWAYGGLDLSPAPDRDVSIGAAIENFTGAKFGSSGTMTAAALITDVLREVPVKHTGYSGLMLPVLEDNILAQRWSEGAINLDALLAYSAVCGTGLDTIPLPGDVSEEQLERIIGDMASLAVKLRKPLSARLMPVAGKKAAEGTEFQDPSLVNATLQRLP